MLRYPVKQNAAKAPLIIRRPSRIIAQPTRTARTRDTAPQSTTPRPPLRQQASTASSVHSFSSLENAPTPNIGPGGSTLKGSVGLGSALGRQVILRVKVTVSADVHFTTTISVSVPSLFVPSYADVQNRRYIYSRPDRNPMQEETPRTAVYRLGALSR